MSEKLSTNGGTQEITDAPSLSGSVPSDTENQITHEDLNTEVFQQSELGAQFRSAERLAHKANDALDRAKQVEAEIHSEIEKSHAERDKMLADRAKGIETGRLPKAKNLNRTSLNKISQALNVFENIVEKADEAMPARQELEYFVGKSENCVEIGGVLYETRIEEEVIDGKVCRKVILGERIGESKASKQKREKKERKAGSTTGKVSPFERTREDEKSNYDRTIGRPWRPVPKEIQWDHGIINPGTSFEPTEDTED